MTDMTDSPLTSSPAAPTWTRPDTALLVLLTLTNAGISLAYGFIAPFVYEIILNMVFSTGTRLPPWPFWVLIGLFALVTVGLWLRRRLAARAELLLLAVFGPLAVLPGFFVALIPHAMWYREAQLVVVGALFLGVCAAAGFLWLLERRVVFKP